MISHWREKQGSPGVLLFSLLLEGQAWLRVPSPGCKYCIQMIRQLLLASLFITAFAQWDVITQNEAKRTQIYCGEELNKALFLICGGLYNSPFKKSSLQSYDDYYSDYNLMDSLEQSGNDYRFPFHPKARAMSALQYKRLKRGVHDECCRKSCSINEIKGYCLKRN